MVPVADGGFRVPPHKGLLPGKYRVVVQQPPEDLDTGRPRPIEFRPFVTEVEVPPGRGTVELDLPADLKRG